MTAPPDNLATPCAFTSPIAWTYSAVYNHTQSSNNILSPVHHPATPCCLAIYHALLVTNWHYHGYVSQTILPQLWQSSPFTISLCVAIRCSLCRTVGRYRAIAVGQKCALIEMQYGCHQSHATPSPYSRQSYSLAVPCFHRHAVY
jgi:hypothetical protein